jgi:hypothetical protein
MERDELRLGASFTWNQFSAVLHPTGNGAELRQYHALDEPSDPAVIQHEVSHARVRLQELDGSRQLPGGESMNMQEVAGSSPIAPTTYLFTTYDARPAT